MQITTENTGDLLEMHVKGRLDNESAEHLSAAIDEILRQGRHSVVVHLAEVNYVSSAGLGALVRAHKQFKAIRGFFGVGAASPSAAEVIRLTGLTKLLMCDLEEVRKSLPGGQATAMPTFRIGLAEGMQIEVYNVSPGAKLTCRTFGDPEKLDIGYSTAECRRIEFPADTLGLGLGAFGQDATEGAPRMGEFLAVAGSAAQQPTLGSNKPDYQLGAEHFVPHLQTLYGLSCTGPLADMIPFEPADDKQRIPFSYLVDQCLGQLGAPQAALVFLAESAGLVGARLRRSPAAVDETGGLRLAHPEIRRWLSFSPERAFQHTLALVVGVASRGAPSGGAAALAPLLRPLRPGGDVWGHFHAAVFSYRPFKKRKLDLHESVTALYENEDLQAVLHLLHDDRDISGGGESEFVSGACWLGPIERVVADGGPTA